MKDTVGFLIQLDGNSVRGPDDFSKVSVFFSAETLVCGQHHQKKGKATLRQPFSVNAKASQANCEHQSSYIYCVGAAGKFFTGTGQRPTAPNVIPFVDPRAPP